MKLESLVRIVLLVALVSVPLAVCAQTDSEAPAENLDLLVEAARTAFDQADELSWNDEARAVLLQEAQQHMEKIRAASPQHPWLSYLFGRYYLALGHNADGASQLETFVKTRDGRNEWSAYRHLGDLYVEEFPQLAKGNYLKAIALQPDHPALLYGLSRCALKLVDYDEAESLGQKAMDRDRGRHPDYIGHLAEVYKAQGKLTEAEQAARQALEVSRARVDREPGRSEPLELVDARLQQLVRLAEARLRDDPTDAEGYLRLVRYKQQRAQLGAKLADLDALRTLTLAMRNTQPRTPVAVVEAYGSMLAKVGRTEEAIQVLEPLLETHPNNAVARDWLSRLKPDAPALKTPSD